MCLAHYVRKYLLCISSCHHHSDKLTGLRHSTLCQTLWCFFFVFGCIASCIENFTSDHSKSSWNYPKTFIWRTSMKRTTNKKKKTIVQEDRKGCVSEWFRTKILFLCFYYWNFDFCFVFCSFVDILPYSTVHQFMSQSLYTGLLGSPISIYIHITMFQFSCVHSKLLAYSKSQSIYGI